MQIIQLLKLYELNNIKESITQIGGLDVSSEMKKLDELNNQLLDKLNNLISKTAENIKDRQHLQDMIDGISGGGDHKLNINNEYDFINDNIKKLDKLNNKYLSDNMKELQYQLEYSDELFTEDLESLDDPDDSNYALVENLNYTKNAKKNNMQTIFSQPLSNGNLNKAVGSNVLQQPIIQNALPHSIPQNALPQPVIQNPANKKFEILYTKAVDILNNFNDKLSNI